MHYLLLVALLSTILLGACTSAQTSTPQTEILVSPTAIPTPLATEPASHPSPTASPTKTPTPAPSLTSTPVSIEDWAQANPPDQALLQAALATYTQSLGLPLESIQTEVQMRTGVNGPFAVLVDKETGVPFFISKNDENGNHAWQSATLDNVAQERGMRFGALLNLNRDFHSITVDNFGTGNAYIDWNLVQAQKGVWDFSDPGYNIETAHENGLSVMANLIWGKNIADWARQDPDLHAVMVDYITQVMTYYKGEVSSWNVFNEANRDANDIFWNKLGLEGVRDAYSTARAVDPSARLLYNDFVDLEGYVGVHNPPIIDTVVSQLQQDGNIDGIALQVTGRTNRLDLDKLRTALQDLKKYNLPIIVPEFSILIEGENTPDNLREQARVGAEVISALRECDCVVEVIAFGLEDRLTNEIYKLDNANAGFWLKTETGSYIPKPIVYEMLAALASDDGN